MKEVNIFLTEIFTFLKNILVVLEMSLSEIIILSSILNLELALKILKKRIYNKKIYKKKTPFIFLPIGTVN